jgi:uncharacterized protein YbgA (DUF1722 family)
MRRSRRLTVFRRGWTVGDLMRFHAVHKLELMARSPTAYRDLGRLVAQASREPRAEVERAYSDAFSVAIVEPATRGRHVNVLQHAAGYFKKGRDLGQLAAIHAAVAGFADGRAALGVPLGLIRRAAREVPEPYLVNQTYLRRAMRVA